MFFDDESCLPKMLFLKITNIIVISLTFESIANNNNQKTNSIKCDTYLGLNLLKNKKWYDKSWS